MSEEGLELTALFTAQAISEGVARVDPTLRRYADASLAPGAQTNGHLGVMVDGAHGLGSADRAVSNNMAGIC
jgi:hypothetical protein